MLQQRPISHADHFNSRIVKAKDCPNGPFYTLAPKSAPLLNQKSSGLGTEGCCRDSTIKEAPQSASHDVIPKLISPPVRPVSCARLARPFNEAEDCVICGSRPSRPDARCQSVRYCSKKCQEFDWPSHKLLCKTFTRHAAKRPSPAHRRAIFFPHDKAKPIVVYVLCEKVMDDVGVQFEYPHASTYLGSDDPITDSLLVKRNAVRDQALSHIVEIIHRDDSLKDPPKSNTGIESCLGISNSSWNRGSAIIFRRKDASSGSRFYYDITLADYRHALDYFNTNFGEVSNEKEAESPLQVYQSAMSSIKVSSLVGQIRCRTPPIVGPVERHTFWASAPIS